MSGSFIKVLALKHWEKEKKECETDEAEEDQEEEEAWNEEDANEGMMRKQRRLWGRDSMGGGKRGCCCGGEVVSFTGYVPM